MKMKRFVLASALLACGFAVAKLPAPQLDDAAKAKAAEAAAKTAWQSKVDAYLTCKAQDKVAAKYHKAGSPAALTAKPASAAGSAPAVAAQAAASSAQTPAPAVTASAPTIPPCADPGPFAFNQPSQTPLETSGAHSPAGNATAPPSVNKTSSEMKPAEKKKS